MSDILQQCSFCGKSKNTVNKLIVGENSAICNDCVSLCVDLLKDEPGDLEITKNRYFLMTLKIF